MNSLINCDCIVGGKIPASKTEMKVNKMKNELFYPGKTRYQRHERKIEEKVGKIKEPGGITQHDIRNDLERLVGNISVTPAPNQIHTVQFQGCSCIM